MKLGIDIGGTTIGVGISDGKKVIDRCSVPSFDRNATLEETISYLTSIIDGHISADISGIGIGVPSVVDAEKGIVYNTVNIPSWKEVHLKEIIEERYHIPVKINNDANCFVSGAEAVYGNGEDEILVGVTLGTGVGIGVMFGKKILNGANAGCGELTWLPYNGKTIEDWSGKNFFCSRGIDPSNLYESANRGDADSKEIFAEYGKHVASLLCVVIGAYDPNRIVFGGGISAAHKYFEKSMMDSLREKFIFPESVKKLKIDYLTDSDAAILGASNL